MYGENCSISCGHCLTREQCHHINGTCMNGCDSGYQGSSCTEGNVLNITRSCRGTDKDHIFKPDIFSLECDTNHFGPNCRYTCNANCRSCNKTTGVCEFGCKAGWKGVMCNTGEIKTFYEKYFHFNNRL